MRKGMRGEGSSPARAEATLARTINVAATFGFAQQLYRRGCANDALLYRLCVWESVKGARGVDCKTNGGMGRLLLAFRSVHVAVQAKQCAELLHKATVKMRGITNCIDTMSSVNYVGRSPTQNRSTGAETATTRASIGSTETQRQVRTLTVTSTPSGCHDFGSVLVLMNIFRCKKRDQTARWCT